MSKTEPATFATRADTDRLYDLLKTISEGIGMSVDSIRTTAMTQNKYNNSALDAQDQQLRDIKEILNAMVERIDNLDERIEGVVAQAAELTRTSAGQFDILMGSLTDVDTTLSERFDEIRKNMEIQDQQLMVVGRAFDSMENKIHEWYRTAGRRHDEIMGQLHDMAEGRPEPQVKNQPTQALSDSELRNPTARHMAHIMHLYEELMKDNKRIRYDIQLHWRASDGIVRNLTGRISKLDIARETQDDEIALLKGRIKALESNHEPQDDILSERRGETSTLETPINVPAGYRVERVAYNQGDVFEVVQRWLDSTPEFFQTSAGGMYPLPIGIGIQESSKYTHLEIVMLATAERLRRRRVEALKSQLGAFGPESHGYPSLKTQGANARTGADEGQS